MATITTRAGKGTPLTNTEVDNNFTNLNTDKIENVVEDTTPQLGGNLDLNSNDITGTGNINVTGTVTADSLTVDTDTLYVDATNNRVGIGTDSPSDLLELSGSTAQPAIRFTDEDVAGLYHRVFTPTNTGLTISADTGNVAADSFVRFDVDGTEVSRVTSTGIDVTGTVTADENITIDTSSSGNGLTIQSSGNTYNRLTFDANRSASGNLLGEIMGEWNGTQVAAIRVSAGSDTTNKDDGQIYFLTSSDGTGNKNRVNIANNGDISFYDTAGSTAGFHWDAADESLGIGTTSPNTTVPLTIEGSTSGIQFTDSDLEGNWNIVVNGGNFRIQQGNVGSSPTEAMRIDSSGNVGIGNALSTSNPTGGAYSIADPDSKTIVDILRVGEDDGSTVGVSEIQIVGYGSNTDSGGGSLRFLNSRYSSTVAMIKGTRESANEGYLKFYTGNTSALSQTMTLDSSGNLLIGTTDGSGFTTSSTNSGVKISDGIVAVNGAGGSTAAGFFNVFDDGTILDFRKDGTTVGIVASRGGVATNLILRTATGQGAGIGGANSGVLPCDEDGLQDDEINLGASGTRWKDLYLSGGIVGNNNNIYFKPDGTNADMTLDASGNLLVGKTSSSLGTQGCELRAESAYFTRNGGTPVFINRETSDGEIVQFRKDNASVGSIGTISGDLYIASSDSGHEGLKFGNGAITPVGTTGASTDAACNLGGATSRFNDLYLSGVNYIGDLDSGSAGTTGKNIQSSQDFSTVYSGSNAATWAGMQLVNHDDTSNRTSVGLSFVHRSSSSGIAGIQSTSDAGDRADIRFSTRSSDGVNERMVLDYDGNLGINVTPNSKLTVSGDKYVLTNSGQSDGIRLYSSTAPANGDYTQAVSFGYTSGSSAIAGLRDGADSDQMGLAFIVHGSAIGSSDATEAMRLDASGNLLVGRSSSPTNANGVAINPSLSTDDRIVLGHTSGTTTTYGGSYISTSDGFGSEGTSTTITYGTAGHFLNDNNCGFLLIFAKANNPSNTGGKTGTALIAVNKVSGSATTISEVFKTDKNMTTFSITTSGNDVVVSHDSDCAVSWTMLGAV